MAKITRKQMKIFGSLAGPFEIGEFGSLAAGTPAYTTDPDVIQGLSNFLDGWFGAIVGGNSPAIEDMNALCYLYAYQLAYIFQSGIPEWNAQTTYYIGSFATDGLGGIYYSLTDNNINNALSSTANWQKVGGPNSVLSKTAAYQILPGDYLVQVSTGTFAVTMPDATLVSGKEYIVKKTDSGTTQTIIFLGGQSADGQTTLTLNEQYQFFGLISNGVNYDIVRAG